MEKFLHNVILLVSNLATGLDGNETAKIKGHKLWFWVPGWRLYKVFSEKTPKEYYIIANTKLPKYKYKTFMITGNMKRLTNELFLWREKK